MAEYYKIKICNQYERHNICSYGQNCKYAHGKHELRCKFHQEGRCIYGESCFLIHDKQDSNNMSKSCEKIDCEDNKYNIKQEIVNDLKNNEYIEDITENDQSIQFNINIEKIKKQSMIDWVNEYSDIDSEEYKTDPFLNQNIEEISFEDKIIDEDNMLDQYIYLLKEYILNIENKKEKLNLIPGIFWKKLISDLKINKNILNID